MLTAKDSTYKRLMNSSKWKHLRRLMLIRYPLCQNCLAIGRISATEEIHHITPIQIGVSDNEKERLAFDTSNLIALCHNCHVEEHKRLGKQSKADRERRKVQLLENFRKTFLE